MLQQLIDLLDSGVTLPGGSACVSGGPMTFFRLQDGMPPDENGAAALFVEKDALRVLGAFRDSDIGNAARKNNEQTWKTGDVMECFVQLPGKEDYFEFHVTPENYTLQLHLPSESRKSEGSFEEKLCETGLRTTTRCEPERNLWCGELVIPFAGIGLTEELLNGLSFAICRYNYNGGKEPEISSTVSFSGETFHAPAQWHVLRA